ncbi:MAG: matrixin family metalloprotease [Thaumarchaeota archaeon]|nr:matrixin family metalloprotease [Nitrososphaerota archaeon]
MRVAFIVLFILIGVVTISEISQSFAEKDEVPNWIKTTLALWSNGEITNEEFVKAIDYLTAKGIVTISSINDKEVQRQVEYLKAKSEVFQEEAKDLREENKEYRILLKSQEINKSTNTSTKNPTSLSKMFDEYQILKTEIKKLRETNKQFSKNIDAWISNTDISEYSTSSNVNNEKLIQVKSEFVDQLNNLKMENKKYEEKMDKLKENTVSYKNNIELLKLENQNKEQLILALKERTQENRENLNQLIQGSEVYESMISQLRDESFIQKQKIVLYENKIKSFDKTFNLINIEKTENDQNINKLKKQNFYYVDTINELEGISQEQKEELISVTNELVKASKLVGILSGQIYEYESAIKSLKDESVLFQNKINYVEDEKTVYQDRISQLEIEKIEQRKTLFGKINDAEESSKFATALNSRLSNFQKTIDYLENENTEYQSAIHELESENIKKNTSLIIMKNDIDSLNDVVIKLNSKMTNYEKTIHVLQNENTLFKNDMMYVQDKNITEHESLIRQLQGEKDNQQMTIISMNVEIEESNELITTLNSKIVVYEKQRSLIEQERSQYKNEITALKMNTNNQYDLLGGANSEIDESNSMIKLLNEENERYQNIINELKEENKVLGKKTSVVTNENFDNLIMITEIESENTEMGKRIELLQHELKLKHEQIDTLKNIQMEKDVKISQIQAQKLQVLEPTNNLGEIDKLSTQNDIFLIELNYLKAKNLVNDEEIEILRGENQEYRVLLNLLKKGQNSVTGIDNVNYDYMNEEGVQGVVMYRTTGMQKSLPEDWIAKVSNSNEYSIYIEPVPKWSKDVLPEVHKALEFWNEVADVQFKIVNAPSFGIISIGWEKELQNGYDGYVIAQTNVSIGLGSDDCDGNWKAYSTESIKNILVHEIGHIVGLEHAVSKSNIMYPMIHDAKFAVIEQSFSIPQDGSIFIRGCSFSADPSYKYQVEVENSKKVDIFFVPSIEEKYRVDSGESFDYYSDINCLGLNKSFKIGVCKEIADSGGMLIINSDNQGIISLNVYLAEQ